MRETDHDQHNAGQLDELLISDDDWKAFAGEVASLGDNHHNTAWIMDMLNQAQQVKESIQQADLTTHQGQQRLQRQLEALAGILKAGATQLEARLREALALINTAEKKLRARESDAYDGRKAREYKRQLQAADSSRDDPPTVRDLALEGVKQSAYFIAQVRWLHQRFPDAEFADVPGLCRAVTQQEIEDNDWSLTPGRYVGVAPVEEENEQDFAERMREIHSELAELNEKSLQFAKQIQINIAGLVE